MATDLKGRVGSELAEAVADQVSGGNDHSIFSWIVLLVLLEEIQEMGFVVQEESVRQPAAQSVLISSQEQQNQELWLAFFLFSSDLWVRISQGRAQRAPGLTMNLVALRSQTK